jgi:hypothetical protein
MQLIDLGETIEPTDEQIEAAKIVAKRFGFELDNED